MAFIYCFTNRLNGKQYVGKWVRAEKYLLARHKSAADNNEPFVFPRAIRKYGWDSFDFEILFQGNVSNKVLSQLEIDFISDLNTKVPFGYNMTAGGEGGATGISPEGKERLRLANVGRRHTPEALLKMSIASKNRKPPSTEARAKMGHSKGKTYEEMYGVERAAALKQQRSERGKQFRMTEEAKQHLSQLNKGKRVGPFSLEHKMKIANALRGKKKTPEHVANIIKSKRKS